MEIQHDVDGKETLHDALREMFLELNELLEGERGTRHSR